MMLLLRALFILTMCIILNCAALDSADESSSSSSWQLDFMLNALGIKSQAPVAGQQEHQHQQQQQQHNNVEPNILVIGAGMPRTGTDSLRSALDHLGYHTYHAKLTGLEGHNPVWKRVFETAVPSSKEEQASTTTKEEEEDEAFNDVVTALANAGYNATTDFPTFLLYDQLARRFPNAKIVLSVRDSSHQWAASFANTVGGIMAQSLRSPMDMLTLERLGPFYQYFQSIVGNIEHSSTYRLDQHSLARLYDEWMERVQADIPAERLLIHNPKDGWRPLCEFLEVQEQCPDEDDIPYPHHNSTAMWQTISTVIYFISDTWPYILLVPLMIVALLVRGVWSLVSVVSWLLGGRSSSSGSQTSTMQREKAE